MDRTERQQVALNKIVRNNCVGTVEAATGFGKTRIATEIIKLLRRNDTSREVIIVVPTIPLKTQWEEGLLSLGLQENARVYVINSLIKNSNLECSLLVLDEIHRYAAKTFSEVFSVVKYSFILGLTATMKRLDGKHALLKTYAPIRDRVTMRECKKNGWLAPYIEYNFGIKLDEPSREWYQQATITYGKAASKFQNNFDIMRQCSFGVKVPVNRANGNPFDPYVVKYARQLGWTGNSPFEALRLQRINATASRGQKRDIWGNADEWYSPQRLYVSALNGMRALREMREFIYNYPKKREIAAQLIEHFSDYKCLTFAETTSTADALVERIGHTALAYHSNLESYEKKVRKTKSYKTESGALKFIEKNPEYELKKLKNEWQVYTYVDKVISPTTQKKEALRKLKETKTIRTVCTAKALDQGFDFPGCQLGIILARTSSPTQQIQRTGRITRKHFFADGSEKESIMVNIYLEDTKDQKWLEKAQRSSAGSISVHSLEEIISYESKEVVVSEKKEIDWSNLFT